MNKAQALQKALVDAYLEMTEVDRTLFPVNRASISYTQNATLETLTFTVVLPAKVQSDATSGALEIAVENFIPA